MFLCNILCFVCFWFLCVVLVLYIFLICNILCDELGVLIIVGVSDYLFVYKMLYLLIKFLCCCDLNFCLGFY